MKLLNPLVALAWILFVTSAIGCDRSGDRIVSTSDDVLISVPNDGTGQEVQINPGAVFVGDATDEDFENDPILRLNAATIIGDTLQINLTFSGGCEVHEFTLVASEPFLEVDANAEDADMKQKVTLNAYLAHNANGDRCEAAPTEDWHFNLMSIKRLYQQVYHQESGTIILRLKDAPAGELVYEFMM